MLCVSLKCKKKGHYMLFVSLVVSFIEDFKEDFNGKEGILASERKRVIIFFFVCEAFSISSFPLKSSIRDTKSIGY